MTATQIMSEVDQFNQREPLPLKPEKPQENFKLAFVCFIVPLVLVIVVMIIGLVTAGKGISVL
jgi:hypothetical protein